MMDLTCAAATIKYVHSTDDCISHLLRARYKQNDLLQELADACILRYVYFFVLYFPVCYFVCYVL